MGELIYIAPDERTVMSVAVTPGAPPHFAEPVRLFRVPAGLHDMIISADHERFVYVQGDLESARRGATVIQHWTGLLEGAK